MVSILSLIVVLIVIGLAFWVTSTLAETFKVPAPVVVVIQVLLVILAILALLQMFGVTSGLRIGL